VTRFIGLLTRVWHTIILSHPYHYTVCLGDHCLVYCQCGSSWLEVN